MNFVNKADLLWNLHNGCDHSYMVYHIANYLSSAEYENLSRAFYKTLTLQKYWRYLIELQHSQVNGHIFFIFFVERQNHA